MRRESDFLSVPPRRKPLAGRQRIYSERQVKLIDPVWVPGPVPRGWWDDDDNCRNYLLWLARKLNFRYMEDWYKITSIQLSHNHGRSLLRRRSDSRAEVVMAYFPEYEWYEWRFPVAPHWFWHKIENRKRYYAWLGKKLGFRRPADWRRLTCEDVYAHHGARLMSMIPAIGDIRQECCPEIEWQWERGKTVTVEQILRTVDEHFATYGEWPIARLGPTLETGPSWAGVDFLLHEGRVPSVPAGTSLADFLLKERGKFHHLSQLRLSTRLILRWADAYFQLQGDWPNQHSGPIPDTQDNWGRIDAALRAGRRGLPGGSSLARLLEKERGRFNRLNRPRLSEQVILGWADAYFESHGGWPTSNSGPIPNAEATWRDVDNGLSIGLRGLPGGSSLARLLKTRRGVPERMRRV